MKHRFALPSAGLAAVLWFSCAHAAQALQSANLVDEFSVGLGAGNEILRVRMRHDVARMIHDEHHATADTGVSQTA